MRPVFFEIGPLPIYAYGCMILIGFLSAMYVASRRFRAKGIDPEHVYDVGLIAMVFGILGARLYYVAQYHDRFDWKLFKITDGVYWPGIVIGLVIIAACYHNARNCYYLAIAAVAIIAGRYNGFIRSVGGSFHLLDYAFIVSTAYLAWKNAPFAWKYFRKATLSIQIISLLGTSVLLPVIIRGLYCYRFASDYSWNLFMIWRGGLVFYGGFIFATAVLFYFLKKKNLPVLKVCDVLAPCLGLGLAFTRIGCFCNGCCFGGFCSPDTSWGVHYPPESLVGEKNLRGLEMENLYRSYAHKDYGMWLNSPLFSIDMKRQNELNNGEFSKGLRQKFIENGQLLAADDDIGYIASGKKWVIKEGSRVKYYILKVRSLVFKTGRTYQKSLNNSVIPKKLEKGLAGQFRILSSHATVVVKKRDREWLLVDSPYEYTIVYNANGKENDKLRVYANTLNVYPAIHWGRSLDENVPGEVQNFIFKPVYPSQLVSSLAGFLLFIILSLFYRYRKNDGEVVLMFAILYGIARFFLEFLRDDTPPVLGTPLTAGQFTSCMLFCCCSAIFIMLRIRPFLAKNLSKNRIQ